MIHILKMYDTQFGLYILTEVTANIVHLDRNPDVGCQKSKATI